MLCLLLIYAVCTDAQNDTPNSISNNNSMHNPLDIVIFERESVELTGKGQIICDKTKISILGLKYEKVKSNSQTTKCKSITDLTNYAAELERKNPYYIQIRKTLEDKLKVKQREHESLEKLISDKDIEYAQLEYKLSKAKVELQKAKDAVIDLKQFILEPDKNTTQNCSIFKSTFSSISTLSSSPDTVIGVAGIDCTSVIYIWIGLSTFVVIFTIIIVVHVRRKQSKDTPNIKQDQFHKSSNVVLLAYDSSATNCPTSESKVIN